MSFVIETMSAPPRAADFTELCGLLRDAVESGASVGYLLPVREEEMANFWQAAFEEVRAGHRIVLAARVDGRIAGSVQLGLATRPNARHRAELQKLLVAQAQRRRGLGTALMHAAEATARTHGRSLLVLDTSATGNALGLYSRCGYTRAGVIPRFAGDPDGSLIDTVIYYKELQPALDSRAAGRSPRCGTATVSPGPADGDLVVSANHPDPTGIRPAHP